jgi:hypothetical protein
MAARIMIDAGAPVPMILTDRRGDAIERANS